MEIISLKLMLKSRVFADILLLVKAIQNGWRVILIRAENRTKCAFFNKLIHETSIVFLILIAYNWIRAIVPTTKTPREEMQTWDLVKN